jgi:hypothetical protein
MAFQASMPLKMMDPASQTIRWDFQYQSGWWSMILKKIVVIVITSFCNPYSKSKRAIQVTKFCIQKDRDDTQRTQIGF